MGTQLKYSYINTGSKLYAYQIVRLDVNGMVAERLQLDYKFKSEAVRVARALTQASADTLIANGLLDSKG